MGPKLCFPGSKSCARPFNATFIPLCTFESTLSYVICSSRLKLWWRFHITSILNLYASPSGTKGSRFSSWLQLSTYTVCWLPQILIYSVKMYFFLSSTAVDKILSAFLWESGFWLFGLCSKVSLTSCCCLKCDNTSMRCHDQYLQRPW